MSIIVSIIVGGKHSPALRCYRINNVQTDARVTHLKTAKKFDSFNQLCQTAQTPYPSLLFIERANLPDELTTAFADDENFSRFCQVIAFTVSPVFEMYSNSLTLAASSEDHGNCTHVECPGIPITPAQEEILETCAYSFTRQELEDFLGDFYRYQGSMLVINLHMLRNPSATTISLQACINAIKHLMQIMQEFNERLPSMLPCA